MRWQAIIKVGLFGRTVKTGLYRWRWMARMAADCYCLCEMRQTEYRMLRISLKPDGNCAECGQAWLAHNKGQFGGIDCP